MFVFMKEMFEARFFCQLYLIDTNIDNIKRLLLYLKTSFNTGNVFEVLLAIMSENVLMFDLM